MTMSAFLLDVAGHPNELGKAFHVTIIGRSAYLSTTDAHAVSAVEHLARRAGVVAKTTERGGTFEVKLNRFTRHARV